MKKSLSVRLLGSAFLLFLGDGGIWTVCAQTTEPLLRIEAGTHNASIFGIAIDPTNHLLVTASEDKTARVWDISGRGTLLRILRPPVGAGEEGHLSQWPCPRTLGLWRAGAEPALCNKLMLACTCLTLPPAPSPVVSEDCLDTSIT